MTLQKFSRRALLCAALLAVSPLCGCGLYSYLFPKKLEALRINPEFSANIQRLKPNWPGPFYELSPGQTELLGLKGSPAFVRLWYNPAGDFEYWGDTEVYRHLKYYTWQDLERSWIYTDHDTEYTFDGPDRYVPNPLSDMQKMMCKYGDPDESRDFIQTAGPPIIQWTYYQRGVRYKFLKGKLFDTQHQPPINYHK